MERTINNKRSKNAIVSHLIKKTKTSTPNTREDGERNNFDEGVCIE